MLLRLIRSSFITGVGTASQSRTFSEVFIFLVVTPCFHFARGRSPRKHRQDIRRPKREGCARLIEHRVKINLENPLINKRMLSITGQLTGLVFQPYILIPSVNDRRRASINNVFTFVTAETSSYIPPWMNTSCQRMIKHPLRGRPTDDCNMTRPTLCWHSSMGYAKSASILDN